MKEDKVPYKLPKEWIWTTIGDLGVVVSGGTPSTNEPQFWNGEIPWITPADLSEYKNKYISKGRRGISKLGLDYSSAVLLPTGSLVYSSRAPIGYVAITQKELTTNQGFKSLIPVKSTYIDFIYYYLQYAKEEAIKRASGTTFLELSIKGFSQIQIPVPSLETQRKIVSKVEELFSELDEAKYSLEKIIKQIIIYKYSILKSAFKGNLTKEWRLQNKENNSIEYLEKIKNFKKGQYLKRLKEWQRNPNKKKKPGEEVEILVENKKELPKLPNNWSWEPLGNMSNIIRGASPRPAGDPKYFGGKIPWITVGELTKDNSVYLSSVSNYVTDLGKAQSRFIEKGNLLITNSGATLGVPKITLIDGCINDGSVAIMDLIDDNTRLYFYWFLKSKTDELRKNSQGAGQPNLNTEIIKNILIPMPSFEEAKLIVQEIEYRFIIGEKLNETIHKTLGHINILRTSILKQAFSGKLIQSNSKDEPVHELLNKIKTEKKDFLIEKKIEIKNKPKKIKLMQEKKNILQILKASKVPLSAKDVWLQSKHKDDIESFYSELREIQNQILEIKKDTESLLSLRHENR